MSSSYECKLSEELQKKALENLREDENLRNQSLDQFREWIEKHPRIKKCPMDANFLLRFLRTKKFSVPDALKLLENYLTTRKVLPQVFDGLTLDDPALKHCVSNGMILILPEPDKEGRVVISYNAECFDTSKYTATDANRVLNFALQLACFDERAQICGIAHAMDWGTVTLSLVSLLTIPHIKNITQCLQKTFPLRHGIFFIINLPTYCVAVFKLALSCFSEKLRKRFHVVKNWDRVHEEIGSSVLAKEDGGTIPRLELAKKMIDLAEKHREEILSQNDFDIEVSDRDINFGNTHDADLDAAIVGSFRKINVD
ncbi:clavesin-1-like [Lutzomyia longipalpis]|uniref:clavesin-1-like n=1 Tax=Lutzomyia longipalpis TaxID=7200 RepID=UPI0024844B77|nr:clavesin-1-like [Lutzomyia longipalpis]